MRTFRARYPGRCGNCDEPIEPGDEVTYVDEDVVHADCDTPEPTGRPTPVCPACHLTQPCDCQEPA